MKINSIKLIFKDNFNIIIFFQLIKIISNECSNRDKPLLILSDNICNSKCTEEQLKSGKCIIDNNIIKTQWLNNIINIKESGYKYIDFVILPNGDMVAETHPFPCHSKRILYGLKKNGRYLFKTEDNKEETPILYLDTDKRNNLKYESAISFIILNNKKYILSIGRLESNIEVIDFENKIIYNDLTQNTIGKYVNNFRTSLINLNNKNSFIFGCLVQSGRYFKNYIVKFQISINNLNKIIISEKSELENSIGLSEMQSHFVTENNIIITFFAYSSPSAHFNITALEPNLNIICEEKIEDSNINKDYYFSSFHFKGEVGAFVYFKKYNDGIKSYYYPYIFFKEYKSDNLKIQDYFSINNYITLNKYSFMPYLLNNDFKKISNNKIGKSK